MLAGHEIWTGEGLPRVYPPFRSLADVRSSPRRAVCLASFSILPQHVEETVAAIARLHATHYSEAAPFQRVVRWATGSIARPRTLGVFLVAVLGWLALNLRA